MKGHEGSLVVLLHEIDAFGEKNKETLDEMTLNRTSSQVQNREIRLLGLPRQLELHVSDLLDHILVN